MRKLNKLNRLYQKDLRSILKSDITSDEDLQILAKKLNINDLKIGWLSDYDPKYKGPQILNIGSDSKEKTGTHWVCAYGNEYFDSFGMPPPRRLEHLNWTPLQFQDIDEGLCGQWCLMFIFYKKMNETDKFYSMFHALPSTKGAY